MDRIAGGRRRHWAARCRARNRVVLLLQPPRPPLGRRTGRRLERGRGTVAVTADKVQSWEIASLSLYRFNQAKNSPDVVRRESSFFRSNNKNGRVRLCVDEGERVGLWVVEWWKVKGRENDFLILVPRGGRGAHSRNATPRWRTTSRRPVAASSTSDPVLPGRRVEEEGATILAPFFFFWHPKPFSFSSQRKRKWVWPPRREAHVLPTLGKQQPPVREDKPRLS